MAIRSRCVRSTDIPPSNELAGLELLGYGLLVVVCRLLCLTDRLVAYVANESNQAIFVRLAADGTTKGYPVGSNSAQLIGAVDHPVGGTITMLDPGMCRILAPAQSVPSVGDGSVMVDVDFHVDVLRHDPDRGFPNA